MKTKLLFLKMMSCIFMLGFTQICHSQPSLNFQYSIDLDEVSFLGNGYNEITFDKNNGVFDAPHWTPSDTKPVSYVSGSIAQVRAKFYVFCPGIQTVIIKGIRNGMDLPEQTVSINQQQAIYPETFFNQGFPNGKVDCYNPFIINWLISFDNGMNWHDAGTSENPLYVTLNQPMVNPIFHTVIHVSCSAAKNESNDATIVKRIFEPYINLEVIRISDGVKLTYYGDNPPPPGCFTTEQLLAQPSGSGRCGAFANIFQDMILVQGIIGSSEKGVKTNLSTTEISNLYMALENYMNPIYGTTWLVEPQPVLFLVKEWGSISNNQLIPLTGLMGYDWNAAQSAPGELGIVGQGGIQDPRSIFPDHAMTLYNGTIYDPSYGVTYNDSLIDFENASIAAGSGVIVTVYTTPTTQKYFFWVNEINNTSTEELIFN